MGVLEWPPSRLRPRLDRRRSLDRVDVFEIGHDPAVSVKNGCELVDVRVVGIDVPFGAEPQQAVLLCQAPDMCGDPTSSFWHLFASHMSCPHPTILSLSILCVVDFAFQRRGVGSNSL
jgi:hypothetical protein